MPKIYKRNCNTCEKYYEGQGDKYCSIKCVPYKNICIKSFPILLDGSSYPLIPSICECYKCNIILWNGRQFVSGHNAKTEDGRKILSDIHLGKPSGMKGKPSPLKGRKHEKLPSQETRYLLSKQRKGKPSGMYGKTQSEEAKELNRQAHLGKSPWNKGLIGFQAKEDHWNWQGGISYLPYCPKFDFNFKEFVRLRDNHICQLCGKTQPENGRKLDVHHIHHDKPNCYPDCIALCKHCNLHEVEKRDKIKYYEDLLMNNLNNRELLFWSKRREKI